MHGKNLQVSYEVQMPKMKKGAKFKIPQKCMGTIFQSLKVLGRRERTQKGLIKSIQWLIPIKSVRTSLTNLSLSTAQVS